MGYSSLKDITKNLNSSLSSAQASANLPPNIEHSIQACLDRELKVDDAASQRLQEDLLSIFNRHIAPVETKLGAFLQALVLLEPYLRAQARKQEWWVLVIRPVLDSFGRRRVEIERASEYMLHVLDYDAEDDPDGLRAKQSAHFTNLLLETYLSRTNTPDVDTQEYSLENEHIASQLESVLVSFGRRKPQDLILALDKLVVRSKHRAQALSLLSAFVRGQPPHLDLVSKTSLIEHLLQCLMIDSSSTVVQLAMTALIMFLPHVPSSIRVHLPRLFLIYSRLLCWDQVEKPRTDEEYLSPDEDKSDADQSANTRPDVVTTGWTKLEGSTGEDPTSLDVSYYFTFLYGLYPLNFISYIRKPRRYMKNISFPRADQLDLDQDAIMQRTEPFRAIHLLHPNFYTTTAEDELENDRWLTSDASDVVAECISLRVSLLANNPQQLPGPPPAVQLPDTPVETAAQSITSPDDARSPDSSSVQSSAASGILPVSRSKTVNKRPPRRPSRPPTGLDPGDSPTLPPAAVAEPRRSSTPSAHGFSLDPSKAALQQQLALLRNDLNFERYLKQQHLVHIGQLQRMHISDATVSANIENLNSTNKSLKTKLTKANDAYAALKKETATGRTQSKKFEYDLSSKLRGLRDAERTWHSEESTLKLDLEKAHRDCDALRKLVAEAEARDLLSNQKIASMELQLEAVATLQARVRELEDQLKSLEHKGLELDQTSGDADVLRIDLTTANLQIRAKEGALDQMRKRYDRRIIELEQQLVVVSENSSPDSDGLSPGHRQKLQDVIDRTVTSVKDRLVAAQKELAQLKRQNVELEIRNQELEAELDGFRAPTLPPQDGSTPRSIPVPRRAGTAPVNATTGHWRNSTGTPTDTDEGSASPRPARLDTFATGHPSLRRSSRGITRISEDSPITATPSIGPSSAPTKNPPLPVGTVPGSPRQHGFSSTPGDEGSDNAALGGGGSSAPIRTGPGLYLNKKSAWSVDSFDSGQTAESGKTKGSGKSGRSGASSLFGMGQNGKKTEGEAEEERKRRERMRRQPPKTGGLKGLRGLI